MNNISYALITTVTALVFMAGGNYLPESLSLDHLMDFLNVMEILGL